MANTYYMTRISLFSILLLIGCGQSGASAISTDYDVTGPTGLRVKYPDSNFSPDINTIEDIYIKTMACAGIQAIGPLVIITDQALPGDHVTGLYFNGQGIIEINTGSSQPSMYWGLWNYRHEFVHYLLDTAGFPTDQNQAHQSELFTRCVYFQ